jgi:hypothetical protein
LPQPAPSAKIKPHVQHVNGNPQINITKSQAQHQACGTTHTANSKAAARLVMQTSPHALDGNVTHTAPVTGSMGNHLIQQL